MSELKEGLIRGCGTRVRGGIYAVVELSGNGSPVEDFLYCPPHLLSREDIASLGISSQGMSLVERETYVLMFDWVGVKHYPYVPDFVEEVRRMGSSRRLPRTLDFKKLNQKSRHLLIHSRAWIESAEQYFRSALGIENCPKGLEEHLPDQALNCDVPMCTGLLWESIEEGVGGRKYWRPRPGFQYLAGNQLPDTSFQPGIFMWLPINKLQVVNDDVAGSHQQALQITSQADLPIELVEA